MKRENMEREVEGWEENATPLFIGNLTSIEHSSGQTEEQGSKLISK